MEFLLNNIYWWIGGVSVGLVCSIGFFILSLNLSNEIMPSNWLIVTSLALVISILVWIGSSICLVLSVIAWITKIIGG